jgi:hypothetical protein
LEDCRLLEEVAEDQKATPHLVDLVEEEANRVTPWAQELLYKEKTVAKPTKALDMEAAVVVGLMALVEMPLNM